MDFYQNYHQSRSIHQELRIESLMKWYMKQLDRGSNQVENQNTRKTSSVTPFDSISALEVLLDSEQPQATNEMSTDKYWHSDPHTEVEFASTAIVLDSG